jgi:hypothetical protein
LRRVPVKQEKSEQFLQAWGVDGRDSKAAAETAPTAAKSLFSD